MKKFKRFQVTGRVQGVFFRAATRDQAKGLGLTGWARNLANGDVEILACGEDQQLRDLNAWLWRGPPHARVKKVISESINSEEFFDDFVIR